MKLHWLAKFYNTPEQYDKLSDYIEQKSMIAKQMKVTFSIDQKDPGIEKTIEKDIEIALNRYLSNNSLSHSEYLFHLGKAFFVNLP